MGSIHKKDKKNSSLAALKNIGKKTSDKKHKNRQWTSITLEEFKRSKDTNIIFSFKFFNRTHKAFNLGNVKKVCDNWFIELLDCLKEVSNRSWGQLINENKFDPHSHNFKKTNFVYDFFDKKTLEQLECVQFRLSKSYGRVHGFLIDNCFYICWLDPHHNMYDSPGYEGVTTYEAAKSCFELLNDYNVQLNHENKELQNKIIKMEREQNLILEELIKAEEKNKELEKVVQELKNNKTT